MKSLFALFLLSWMALVGCNETINEKQQKEHRSAVPVVSRSQWTDLHADNSRLANLPMGDIRFVSVHQTETPLPDTIEEMARLRSIQRWHQNDDEGPGWGDIAYHYLVGPSGTVYEGRSQKYAADSGTVYLTPEQWRSAPQNELGQTTAPLPDGVEKPGASAGHLTICLVGTFHDVLPNGEVRNNLVSLIAEKLKEHDLDLDSVVFHREIACWTDCPGQKLYDWFRGSERTLKSRGTGLMHVAEKLKR